MGTTTAIKRRTMEQFREFGMKKCAFGDNKLDQASLVRTSFVFVCVCVCVPNQVYYTNQAKIDQRHTNKNPKIAKIP